jgi:hypothetical protein
MKRIVVLCSVMILQGLNALGQTNAVPPTSDSVSHPELQGQKAAAKLKAASVSAIALPGSLSRSTEIQPRQIVTFRRIKREGLLLPRISKNDPGEALKAIFWRENDQMGETGIRDTVVTIFPTGR